MPWTCTRRVQEHLPSRGQNLSKRALGSEGDLRTLEFGQPRTFRDGRAALVKKAMLEALGSGRARDFAGGWCALPAGKLGNMEG